MTEKPLIYILHGDEQFAIKNHLDDMISRLGDPVMADLNTTRLDGRSASDEELRTATATMPFLAERRLVVINNPLARLGGQGKAVDEARSRFLSLLESIPPSTALVMVIEDWIERKDWRLLPNRANHWLRKWMKSAGAKLYYRLCRLPDQREMPGWIIGRARELGGEFRPEAAKLLASYIGSDTGLASLEIEKSLIYVDFKRPVEMDDVEELTAPGGQADVFDMVDALAMGSAKQALRLLHLLLEEQEAFSLFGMVVRQFRLLLQAREVLDGGGGQKRIASELNQHPRVAEKLAGQARRFTMDQLEAIYHRLRQIDEDAKSGGMPLELSLETFAAELGR